MEHMMKKISFILCLVGLLGVTAVYGQDERTKALQIISFTNNIDWPGGFGNTFVIAVYGDSPIISELQAMAKVKKIGKAAIEVRKINSIAEINKAQLIFVPSQKKKSLPEINQSLSGKAVLIVSENAASEFGINFIDVNQKVSFQLSKSNLEMHKLKVNSALISLGVLVN